MKFIGGGACLACLLVVCASGVARAQYLTADPIVIGGGHVTVGGDISGSLAPEDPGFFNYTDYEHSALRLFRFDVTGSVRAGGHFTFLGGLRAENASQPEVYAAYVRFRPWRSRALDIQIGRVPPTFGSFSRRTYAVDNPLVGYPLGYQYLTSLRPDAVPANADELLRMRGRGWLSSFSIGNPSPNHGVPLVSTFRWDTGVQVHAASEIFDLTGAVTVGTLSNPLSADDNGGRQFTGRLAFHPMAGLVLGGSAGHGAFLTTGAVQASGSAQDANAFAQTAWGGDAEYSRDYYLIRVETIVSRWTIPAVPGIDSPLGAVAASVEGRYKVRPGLYGAARLDHLAFSTVTGSKGAQTWDAPVTRFEIGGGYLLQRNLQVKLSYQHNWRDTVRVSTERLVAAEVVFWF